MNQNLMFSGINQFDSLCGCFDNICVLSMGLCFPYCLFGRTYKLSGFGGCLLGCCKIFSIQFIVNLFFSGIILNNELKTLYDTPYLQDITNCNTDPTCTTYPGNYTKIYDNNCIIDHNNSYEICDCLQKPLIEKCNYDHNLPEIIHDLSRFILIVSLINFFVYFNINGLFYGYYRTKLSKKYNILHNSRYDFLIHFNPFTHLCALCQEYNTIYRIENKVIQPIYTIGNSCGNEL